MNCGSAFLFWPVAETLTGGFPPGFIAHNLISGGLARISHQADRLNEHNVIYQPITVQNRPRVQLQFVLFGFWPDLASHLGRSALKHSVDYASAADRPTCFARSTQNSEPW